MLGVVPWGAAVDHGVAAEEACGVGAVPCRQGAGSGEAGHWLGTAGVPQPCAARGGCPLCPAPLHPGGQYLPALVSQGDVGVQHSPLTRQIRRDTLCQLLLDEHLQHQQELRQLGKAFYVERL